MNIVSSASEIPLPRILTNTSNCPLNACEVFKIFSQHFFAKTESIFQQQQIQKQQQLLLKPNENSQSYIEKGDVLHKLSLSEIGKRIADVERRLKSVESSLWIIEKGSTTSWNQCTQGTCRCQPVIKSLSCKLKTIKFNHLPAQQIIPANILQM